MGRGRPVKSQIRQNIIELLFFLKEGYGYDLYRHYKDIFPPVSMRVIYYHLRKGADLGEFKINKIVKENGDFSWGSVAEKIYYSLGKEAQPVGNERVREIIERLPKANLEKMRGNEHFDRKNGLKSSESS